MNVIEGEGKSYDEVFHDEHHDRAQERVDRLIAEGKLRRG